MVHDNYRRHQNHPLYISIHFLHSHHHIHHYIVLEPLCGKPNKIAIPLLFNLATDPTSSDWLNKGDNAWQLTTVTLVGLQSVPGLLILYSSIAKKKWAVNSASMALYTFAAVLVCWMGWGYQMSFGSAGIHFIDRPNVALDEKFLLDPAFNGHLPNATMVYFQFVFVAITLILIAGALLGRMNFYAWMLFVPLGLLSLTLFVRLAYGLQKDGCSKWALLITLDALLFTYLLGAVLLWMGWSGFNGGDPCSVNVDASLAVLNTHVCTATGLLTWLLLDIHFFGKPSVIGATQGMLAGLVCITPAAGVVQGWAAIIMGIMSGSIPWYTMMVLHKRMGLLKQVDDTMAVFPTHAVAESLGGILAGVFAEPKLGRLFYLVHDWEHYVVVPLRLSEEELQTGDDALHGEEAYALWGDGEKERFANSKLNLAYGDNFPTKGEVQMA
ncbi:hypothetical protein ACJW30_10G178700 [Castanea mollissima]